MAELGNGSVFSQTDGSNNSGTVPTWAEGMAPSAVNDSARALQGALKRDRDHRGPAVTSGGTANAQTLTYSVAPAAYYQGDVYSFIAGATNTSTCTLNVNSLGAKNIFYANSALAGGEIVSGEVVEVQYDGTQFQITSPVRASKKQRYSSEVTLTDAATISWDLDVAQSAKVTLGGNRTLGAPSNPKAGATYILRVIQDGTGSRTLAYNAAYLFPGGTDPVLSTAAAAVDILSFYSDGTSLYGQIQKAFA